MGPGGHTKGEQILSLLVESCQIPMFVGDIPIVICYIYIYLNHVKSLLGGSSHLLGYIPGSFYGISKLSPLKKLG